MSSDLQRLETLIARDQALRGPNRWSKDSLHGPRLLMAAHLRQEHGMSLRKIATRLAVPYRWVSVDYRDFIEEGWT